MVTESEPLTVKCRYCGARPGERCTNLVNHQPLRHTAAHPMRVRDAESKRSTP